jgi:hypothetical protein
MATDADDYVATAGRRSSKHRKTPVAASGDRQFDENGS